MRQSSRAPSASRSKTVAHDEHSPGIFWLTLSAAFSFFFAAFTCRNCFLRRIFLAKLPKPYHLTLESVVKKHLRQSPVHSTRRSACKVNRSANHKKHPCTHRYTSSANWRTLFQNIMFLLRELYIRIAQGLISDVLTC